MIETIIFCILQSLIFVKFASHVLKPKYIRKSNKILGLILFLLIVSILGIIPLREIIDNNNYYAIASLIFRTVYIVVLSMYIYICYEGNVIQDMILAFTYYLSFDIIIIIIYYCSKLLSDNVYTYYGSTLAIFLLAYLFVTKFASKFMDYKDIEIERNQYVSLLIFCVGGYIAEYIMDYFYITENGYSEITALIIDLLCTVAILLISSYIRLIYVTNQNVISVVERNILLEEQDKLMKEVNEARYKSYQEHQDVYDRMSKIDHDLNHHFNYLLSCDNLDDVKKYIYELKGETDEVGKFFRTGNALIDMILQEYWVKAKRLGTTLMVIGGFDEDYGMQIEPGIASVIFGNLLNNAVEATGKLPEGELKKIDVNFYQDKHKEFYLEISNTADLEKLKIENGEIKTTKADDGKQHGLGLKSVKQILEKCGGRMDITHSYNSFIVTVKIPIQ